MKTYSVNVRLEKSKTILVNAETKDEALSKAIDMYELDGIDFSNEPEIPLFDILNEREALNWER